MVRTLDSLGTDGLSLGEALDSIFQEFKRVGSSYAQAQLGTGLGLALVKRFVEGMGGEITVASAERQGSTFTVRLPPRMAPVDATV